MSITDVDRKENGKEILRFRDLILRNDTPGKKGGGNTDCMLVTLREEKKNKNGKEKKKR